MPQDLARAQALGASGEGQDLCDRAGRLELEGVGFVTSTAAVVVS
jgi:hypothetical protein